MQTPRLWLVDRCLPVPRFPSENACFFSLATWAVRFLRVNGPDDDGCFTSSLIYPCMGMAGIAVGLLESHEKIQGSLSNGLWPSKRSALSS